MLQDFDSRYSFYEHSEATIDIKHETYPQT